MTAARQDPTADACIVNAAGFMNSTVCAVCLYCSFERVEKTLKKQADSFGHGGVRMILVKRSDFLGETIVLEVTGSNSVNVFLGIGMPWLLASFYWYLQGTTFAVRSQGMSFSVLVREPKNLQKTVDKNGEQI